MIGWTVDVLMYLDVVFLSSRWMIGQFDDDVDGDGDGDDGDDDDEDDDVENGMT